MQPAHAYLSQDRIRALIAGEQLPESTTGSVLFADISGFTPLADALARLYGARRGADELTLRLNEVYTLLISQVEVLAAGDWLAGDAITCWFAGLGVRNANANRVNLPHCGRLRRRWRCSRRCS